MLMLSMWVVAGVVLGALLAADWYLWNPSYRIHAGQTSAVR